MKDEGALAAQSRGGSGRGRAMRDGPKEGKGSETRKQSRWLAVKGREGAKQVSTGEEGGRGLTEAGQGPEAVLRQWESWKAFQLGPSLVGLGRGPGTAGGRRTGGGQRGVRILCAEAGMGLQHLCQHLGQCEQWGLWSLR